MGRHCPYLCVTLDSEDQRKGAIRFRANDPNIHAAAAREFRIAGFPADRAPMVAQTPCGTGFPASVRACAYNARDGLPTPARSRDRPAHSQGDHPATPAIGPQRDGG